MTSMLWGDSGMVEATTKQRPLEMSANPRAFLSTIRLLGGDVMMVRMKVHPPIRKR